MSNKFYKKFSSMSKVNFLGMLLYKYFSNQIIGKDENSIEYEELEAILKILEDKFMET